METFDFIQAIITLNLKDPHSKALEPDCLSPPLLAITTQPLKGEGGLCHFLVEDFEWYFASITLFIPPRILNSPVTIA